LEDKKYIKDVTKHLNTIKRVVKELLGENSKVFLFGSIVKKTYTMASDIDVLIFSPKVPESDIKRAKIIAEKRKKSKLFWPFEIHLVNERMFRIYKRMIDKMVEI